MNLVLLIDIKTMKIINKIIRFQNLNSSLLKFVNTKYMPKDFFELHRKLYYISQRKH